MKKCLTVLIFLLAGLAEVRAAGFVPYPAQWTQPLAGAAIRYYARFSGLTVYVSDLGLHYVPTGTLDGSDAAVRIDFLFPTRPHAFEPSVAADAATYRFITTGHSHRAQAGLQAAHTLLLRGIAPGVDLELMEQAASFKYNLLAQDAAALSAFYWQVVGAHLQPEENALHLHTPLGRLAEHIPAAWQGPNGHPLTVQHRLVGTRLYYQAVAAASTGPIVVDPLLRTSSSFIGGSAADAIRSIATLPDGGFAWAGYTDSENFPATAGQVVKGGPARDAVVGVNNANGSLRWATYFGGSEADEGLAVAVDASGAIYLGGSTLGSIATFGLGQLAYGGNQDAFLAKFNAQGLYLWSQYFGQVGIDAITHLAIDTSGFVVVLGTTTGGLASLGTGGLQGSPPGGGDLWMAKVHTTGRLRWAGYYGGTAFEQPGGLAVDARGAHYYLAGSTSSPDLNVPGAAQPAFSGTKDAFWIKLDSAGALRRGTYWGGTDEEEVHGLVLDSAWKPVLLGHTFSPNFPLLLPTQPSLVGRSDLFLARFDTAGLNLWSTYALGGSEFEFAHGLAVNRKQGELYAVGETRSTDLPTLRAGFLDEYRGGTTDGYWAVFSHTAVLLQASYYGGAAADVLYAAAADSVQTVMGGQTFGEARFPALNASQFFYGGGPSDGILVRYVFTSDPTVSRASSAGATPSPLRVYPNPATDQVWVEAMQPLQLALQDVMGRELKTWDLPAGRQLLSLSGLPAGLYILHAPGQELALPPVRLILSH